MNNEFCYLSESHPALCNNYSACTKQFCLMCDLHLDSLDRLACVTQGLPYKFIVGPPVLGEMLILLKEVKGSFVSPVYS